ncbi:MAG: dephospho-CoA kinase [Clostridiales bacterium]|nr:dephospho-CoA kinase [Clostridiales bacterium]
MTEIEQAPRRIGLTGGIGAGKSLVADYLRAKGFPVIDADELAHEATAPGQPALAEIRRNFGDEVFSPNGALDRAALARLVFSDAERRTALEKLLHAEIFRRMEKAIAAVDLQTPAVFLSIPLLFETGAERICDEVWLVTADEGLRLSRAMARDDAPEEQVRARMAAQLPETEKRARADILLENDGSPEALRARIDAQLTRF